MKYRSGSALLLVMTLALMFLLTAIALAVNSASDMGLTNDEKAKIRLELACEAGLKRAKAKVEDSFNNSKLVYLEPSVLFQGTSTDDTGKKPADKAYSDEQFISSNPDYYAFTYQSGQDNRKIYVKYAITEVKNWHRSQSYTSNDLNIEAIAYAPGYGWYGMTENVTARRTTLFMYQVFFANDLEILPGPNFNLTGLIHTNQNLYLNANSGSTLDIYTDSLTSAGHMFRGRLDSSDVSGTVQVTSTSQSGSLKAMTAGNDSTSSNWVNIASNNWQGTVKDSSLGATTLAAPMIESFQPGGYYYDNAGLIIEVQAKGQTMANTTYKITYNGVTNTYTSSQLGGALSEVKDMTRENMAHQDR